MRARDPSRGAACTEGPCQYSHNPGERGCVWFLRDLIVPGTEMMLEYVCVCEPKEWGLCTCTSELPSPPLGRSHSCLYPCFMWVMCIRAAEGNIVYQKHTSSACKRESSNHLSNLGRDGGTYGLAKLSSSIWPEVALGQNKWKRLFSSLQ